MWLGWITSYVRIGVFGIAYGWLFRQPWGSFHAIRLRHPSLPSQHIYHIKTAPFLGRDLHNTFAFNRQSHYNLLSTFLGSSVLSIFYPFFHGLFREFIHFNALSNRANCTIALAGIFSFFSSLTLTVYHFFFYCTTGREHCWDVDKWALFLHRELGFVTSTKVIEDTIVFLVYQPHNEFFQLAFSSWYLLLWFHLLNYLVP